MSIRLLILMALGVILGVYFVMRSPAPSDNSQAVMEDGSSGGYANAPSDFIRQTQQPLDNRALAGEEPPEPPVFDIQVEVNLSSGKNQLCFLISEIHGYYVETLNLQWWWTGKDGTIKPEDSSLNLSHFMDKYVKAGETLRECIELVPPELAGVGGDMGTGDNWGARMMSHGRARLENPDPLPPIASVREAG